MKLCGNVEGGYYEFYIQKLERTFVVSGIGSTGKSAWKTISDYRRSCICDSWRNDFCSACAPGIKYTSKKILQYAVVLLGFGMNLKVVMETGKQSLPIILCTITVSLVIAYVLHRVLRIPAKISTLVGVGSSICGGSAIAATACH